MYPNWFYDILIFYFNMYSITFNTCVYFMVVRTTLNTPCSYSKILGYSFSTHLEYHLTLSSRYLYILIGIPSKQTAFFDLILFKAILTSYFLIQCKTIVHILTLRGKIIEILNKTIIEHSVKIISLSLIFVSN